MPTHPCPHPDDISAQEELDYHIRVAIRVADQEARALAKLTGRRRSSHELLLGAHLILLIDGAGQDAALSILDRMVEELVAQRGKHG